MNTIQINKKPLTIREYLGQMVVTFKDIDMVHERPDGTASRNFRINRKHLIQGKDYFRRNSSEARKEYGITAPNGLILITESGYLMLVKSFTDDLAWKVQRDLVNCYFHHKQERHGQEQEHELPIIKLYGGYPVMTVTEIADITNIPRGTVHNYVKKFLDVFIDYECLTGDKLERFKREYHLSFRIHKKLVVIYENGVDKFIEVSGLPRAKRQQIKAYFDLPFKKEVSTEVSPVLDSPDLPSMNDPILVFTTLMKMADKNNVHVRSISFDSINSGMLDNCIGIKSGMSIEQTSYELARALGYYAVRNQKDGNLRTDTLARMIIEAIDSTTVAL